MTFKVHNFYILLAACFLISCSTDRKLAKGYYYGKKGKIVSGRLGGLNYVMLVTSGKNKYPLTTDFRRDQQCFFTIKTTLASDKLITWHSVTDTTNDCFRSFGKVLVGGAKPTDKEFTQISDEDRKVLFDFSDKLLQYRPNLQMPKDSIKRIIGWVKVN